MISYKWFHSLYPHARPRSKAAVPNAGLFRSKHGHLITTRLAAPSDFGMLADLLAGLSAQSLFLRYCMPMPRMAPEMVARETARLLRRSAQQFTTLAVTESDGAERVIGVAELARDATDPAIAEVALVVADSFQRAGIGSALIGYVMAAARRQGLAALHATALAENMAVRRMVARSGAPYSAETRQGITSIQIDLAG
jgi:acetyltransferase